MHKKSIIIENKTGLHLRPISLIVKKAKEYDKCTITLEANDETANAKSAFEVQELDLDYQTEVTVTCDGLGESLVLEEIIDIIGSAV